MEKQLRSAYKLCLDANEINIDPSTFSIDWSKVTAFNRYPDANSQKLKIALVQELNRNRNNGDSLNHYSVICPKQLIIGTGSDEILKLILEGLTKKASRIIAPDPSFCEYEKLTHVVQGQFIKVPGKEFQIDIEALIQAQQETNASVIFIANPNNPTGQLIPKRDIEQLLLKTDAWVVMDEAYGEFSGETALGLLEKYEKLLITRTLSKAYGLASLRIGYLIARKEIAEELHSYKMTYNVSGVSQAIALEVLKETGYSRKYVSETRKLLEYANSFFAELKQIKIFPSKANFILIKIENHEIYNCLRESFETAEIKVRYFEEKRLMGCIRITLTNREEFELVLEVISTVLRIMNG